MSEQVGKLRSGRMLIQVQLPSWNLQACPAAWSRGSPGKSANRHANGFLLRSGGVGSGFPGGGRRVDRRRVPCHISVPVAVEAGRAQPFTGALAVVVAVGEAAVWRSAPTVCGASTSSFRVSRIRRTSPCHPIPASGVEASVEVGTSSGTTLVDWGLSQPRLRSGTRRAVVGQGFGIRLVVDRPNGPQLLQLVQQPHREVAERAV